MEISGYIFQTTCLCVSVHVCEDVEKIYRDFIWETICTHNSKGSFDFHTLRTLKEVNI
jgi:hypothetical protein